jgi:protein-S-isoprenylcysteine O-methyltransferase Ste14
MKGFPDLPPLWLVGCLVLTWALAALIPIASFSGPLSTGIAWVLTLAGLGLIGWAGLWFWRKRTTIEPHHAPQVLIVEGPYTVSRNPIYLGMIAIAAGAVFWHGALITLPLPAILAFVLQRRFIEPEEIALHMAFGDDALDYISATRRWL